ncbi:hypothetical protein ACH47Z_44235 [Streptomyces sp. NPDC020192]|uniref:hypothetical protein n=1 Tax=Streptomyces sp. NPDC020192 TaxID=3365066 RepID=UPI0037957B63
MTVMFAGAGFAAVAPDYLGLGLGTGLHPYMDIGSETTVSVDMLKAARAFEAEKGVIAAIHSVLGRMAISVGRTPQHTGKREKLDLRRHFRAQLPCLHQLGAKIHAQLGHFGRNLFGGHTHP